MKPCIRQIQENLANGYAIDRVKRTGNDLLLVQFRGNGIFFVPVRGAQIREVEAFLGTIEIPIERYEQCC